MRRVVAVGVLVPTLLAALAVTVGAYSGLGGDTAFIRQQELARPARAVDLERVMRTTPEPYKPHQRNVATVRCRPRGSGELQNPWRCAVGYHTGRRATFVVTLRADGSFRAQHREGVGGIVGCCVQLG